MMDNLGTTPTPNKAAPSNVEAEQAVLGALLIDPDAIIRVAPMLRAEDFYLEKHAWVYEAILELHERREPIDFLSVVSELERRGKLSDAGGPGYLTALINAVPSAIHVEHYAHLVDRASVLRRLLNAAGEIAGIAYDGREDVDAAINRAEEIVFRVAERRLSRAMMPMRQAMDQFIDRIKYLEEHEGEMFGVPTGFRDMDRLLGGLQPSDLIIIAGRPGSGKTSFALSVVYHAAVAKRKNVAFFSLEMSTEQLVQRLVAHAAYDLRYQFPGDPEQNVIDSQSLRAGLLTENQHRVLAKVTGILSEAPIHIDDTTSITPLEIRAKARRLDAEIKLDLIVIDYLQLMTAGGYGENRVQEVAYISRELKALARELKVPVVALSQLSRAVEARQDKRPMLADLRESGSIEQDADVVAFIFREKLYYPTLESWQRAHPNKPYPDKIAEILVAKHRHGPTKEFSLYFAEEQAKFADLEEPPEEKRRKA